MPARGRTAPPRTAAPAEPGPPPLRAPAPPRVRVDERYVVRLDTDHVAPLDFDVTSGVADLYGVAGAFGGLDAVIAFLLESFHDGDSSADETDDWAVWRRGKLAALLSPLEGGLRRVTIFGPAPETRVYEPHPRFAENDARRVALGL